jgi:hypothetical protein
MVSMPLKQAADGAKEGQHESFPLLQEVIDGLDKHSTGQYDATLKHCCLRITVSALVIHVFIFIMLTHTHCVCFCL